MGVLDAFSLAGEVSVVTGAKRGIGRALAIALAEAGSDVALLVRGADEVAPLLEELAGHGVRAIAVDADVADAVHYMLTRPRHVTIDDLVLLPSAQEI